METVFWGCQFPPKSERKLVDLRYPSSKVEFVRLFFGGNQWPQKNHFEINWPLGSPPWSTQCCVFNNSSTVKHRHQIWDQFVIPVFKTEITNWSWILPQFTSLIRKLALVFFFDGFLGFQKKSFFSLLLEKKITFYI